MTVIELINNHPKDFIIVWLISHVTLLLMVVAWLRSPGDVNKETLKEE